MTSNLEEIVNNFQSNWHLVMRPFVADDGKLIAGQIVDTTEWKHTDVLVKNRYLTPIPNGVNIPEPAMTEHGLMRVIPYPKNDVEAVSLDEALADPDKATAPKRKK